MVDTIFSVFNAHRTPPPPPPPSFWHLIFFFFNNFLNVEFLIKNTFPSWLIQFKYTALYRTVMLIYLFLFKALLQHQKSRWQKMSEENVKFRDILNNLRKEVSEMEKSKTGSSRVNSFPSVCIFCQKSATLFFLELDYCDMMTMCVRQQGQVRLKLESYAVFIHVLRCIFLFSSR